ncbi:MAG TPA: protein kinase [Polyangiaceae bacterium]|nr:protein kinase [Polyangiaceae bacterium]
MSQSSFESAAAGSLSSERHQPGQLVAGRYELVRRLGMGGMGVVWVARAHGLGVEVAIKLLHDASADEVAVERMAREARAAAMLGHAAIVRVLDFGRTESGQPFMAMELLQGEDLYRLLKQGGRLSAVDAVTLVLPIVDALVVAHKHGIVHRDLKPENLFVARDALGRIEPKILDFGIAKLEFADDKRLTQVGALLGSPAYLAPEQAEGLEDVDHRVDIWSMGVVLYELVTGELPFDGKTCNAVLRSVARDRPRSITEFAAGNDALWTIVKKCLRKNPDDRWRTMQELGEALARWATEQGADVDVSSRSLREAWLSRGAASRRMRIVGSPAPQRGSVEGEGPRTTQTFNSKNIAARATQIRSRLGRRFGRPATAALVAAGLLGAAWWSFHSWSKPVVATAAGAGSERDHASVHPSTLPVSNIAASEPPLQHSTEAPSASASRAGAVRAPEASRKAPPKRTRAKAADAEFGF